MVEELVLWAGDLAFDLTAVFLAVPAVFLFAEGA